MTLLQNLFAVRILTWRARHSQPCSHRTLAISFLLLSILLLPCAMQSQFVATGQVSLTPILPVSPPKPIGPQSYNFPNLHLLTVQYGNGSIAAPMKPQVAQWLASHFDYNIGGHIDLTSYPSTRWAGYQDGAGAYTGELYSWVHDVAAKTASTTKTCCCTSTRTMRSRLGLTWIGSRPVRLLRATLLAEQRRWISALMHATAHFWSRGWDLHRRDVRACTTTNIRRQLPIKLYLGYAEPFDLVNLNVYTGRSGGSLTGSIGMGPAGRPLPCVRTLPRGVTATGTVQFNPPSNWRPTVVNGSRSKYWVRMNLTGATTAPVLSKVFGDDWFSHYGTNNCRGWNKTDSHRINVGLGNLEYNPTPPANASARFRYQARSYRIMGAQLYLHESPLTSKGASIPGSGLFSGPGTMV